LREAEENDFDFDEIEKKENFKVFDEDLGLE
jgi:hypothetical protein